MRVKYARQIVTPPEAQEDGTQDEYRHSREKDVILAGSDSF
jgi:hypothetical protein